MDAKITLNTYIDALCNKAVYDFKDYVQMLYIGAKSKVSRESKKIVDEKLIENYLKKRGYSMNYVLEKRVMVNGFTCVFIGDNFVEVWHDKSNNNKSVFVNESLLTGLPIILNYMEKI